MSSKTCRVSALGRDFANAWRDYRTGHVVSQHAARTIRNFLATQLAESAEADVEEDEDAKRAPWEHVDTSWVSLQEIREILGKNVALPRKPAGKQQAWEHRVASHNKDIYGWWAPHATDRSVPGGADASSTKCLNTEGCVPVTVKATPDCSKSPSGSSKADRRVEAGASLFTEA
jgi:hypothetical protein